MGIFLEALPFVLIGVIISSFLHVYIQPDTLTKYFPKNKFLGVISGALLGFLFPVCECGNIPVARRLVAKNVSPSIAITFLLSAPVFNPLTLYVTYIAFQNSPEMLSMRIILTLVIAISVGYIFSFAKSKEELLQKTFCTSIEQEKAKILTDTFTYVDKKSKRVRREKFIRFLQTLVHEFLEMISLLSLGGIISSCIQTIIPRGIITSIGQGPISSIIAMMVLALTISICSNVDAFFALSYTNHFTFASILAFLVFGPMIDIKALFMLKSMFRTKIVIYISLLCVGLTLLSTLFINLNIS